MAKLRNNLSKNRYTDVLCYDHSRVVLSEIDCDRESDYIHANFVDGYKQKNAFINTQGKFLIIYILTINPYLKQEFASFYFGQTSQGL